MDIVNEKLQSRIAEMMPVFYEKMEKEGKFYTDIFGWCTQNDVQEAGLIKQGEGRYAIPYTQDDKGKVHIPENFFRVRDRLKRGFVSDIKVLDEFQLDDIIQKPNYDDVPF